ncbi:putative membrane protein [Pseudocercospora fuligena]|uniref:Putative membrane protein n=1 Tax=Pseudocercospora fuligena TaxID=685502 RepID=A0A8H6VLE2_9PEZI|nr:putative membrane protein [Pseudocercospora fuligena]
MITRIRTGLVALIAILSCLQLALAEERWIEYQNAQGETVVLADNRKPSLYTGNFGDCLGDSTINVTRFDAAYYQDNMTVLFHLAGNTGVANDSLMMSISVFAYGEDRFSLIFNPCNANIYSMCPLNSSVPISASGIIPVAQSDVANIPPIALSIPDFEGEAILRIFSNTTQQEIACYSAVVTNGASFGQPASVGTILGIFTLVALIASFATAIYGEAVPTMRLHYAHSLSVGVVFAVWQHIYFTGALSMNWPSVLVAWWSNFAWAGGMIYSSSMQSSINNLIGSNIGNTSQVGAAQAGSPNSDVGGGFDISTIYKRALAFGVDRVAHHPLARNSWDLASHIYRRDFSKTTRGDLLQRTVERTLQRRDTDGLADASDGYKWYGKPVPPGVPLPGNYSGFAGTLAEENIPVSNAFMTGFLWFLILLVLLVAATIAFKWSLELFVRRKWAREDKLKFFRDNWIGYTAQVALRTCYIGWFAMMFLTMFQFTYNSSGGVKGIAAIIFIIFFVGMPLIAGYAFWYKKAITGSDSSYGRQWEHNMFRGKYPVPKLQVPAKKTAETSVTETTPTHNHSDSKASGNPLWKKMTSTGSITGRDGNSKSIHDDEDYTRKFGWLAARFRRTRWWFFTAWLFYEFLRAIFYAGASGYAQAQVFGLLIVEFLAFAFIIWMRPFEGQRLNILVVYCLGFSKVTTVALSAAFDINFNLQRITTTVIGIVIIVIQGILTIITMVAIVVGAISSYMSVSRNKEDFRPRKWANLREKYFDHLDRVVNDLPPPPKPEPPPPEEPKFGFEMKGIKRIPKLEDEDEEFQTEMMADPNASYLSFDSPSAIRSAAETPVNRSRANSRAPSVASMSLANLPYGARAHRPSWSTRDFQQDTTLGEDGPFTPIDMSKTLAEDEDAIMPGSASKRHSRMSIRSNKSAANPPLRAQPSSSSLRIGGEVSTADTIGNVPKPTVRPRSGTMGSVRSGRYASGGFDDIAEGSRSREHIPEVPPLPSASSSRPGSKRNSVHDQDAKPGASNYGRAHPLTPAMEMDEWNLQKTNSRSQ